MFASGFFASEPKGHSRKFRMVCDSRRGYLFRSRRAVLAIKFSLRMPGPTHLERLIHRFSISSRFHTRPRGEISSFGERAPPRGERKLPTCPGRSMTIGRLPRSRQECDNPTRILTVGEKVQYVENADDSEAATHIRVTYRCIDEGDGTDLSEPSAAGQHLELYRRASDPRDLCACMVPLVLLMKRPPKGTAAAVD
jgi:hypothetical protein